VDLKVYRSEKPFTALVLGHGAGAGQLSPFMVATARGLANRGVSTATFDFPYITARRKVPDRAPVLEHAWRDAIEAARREFATLPLFIGGKSMGGRIATHVAAPLAMLQTSSKSRRRSRCRRLDLRQSCLQGGFLSVV